MPFIAHRMPAEEYHGSDGLSASAFRTFLSDPRLYEAYYITKTMPAKRTAVMDLGTVAHAAILEPHIIDGVCLEIPATALNGEGHKKGKAWQEFAEQHANRILLKPSEMRLVRGMFDAAYSNPVARRLLQAPGQTEASVFWDCQHTGLKRRCRPDKIVDGWGWVNVKTTSAGVDSESFRRTARSFGYDVSQEFYRDAGELIYGHRPPYVFLVVEQEPPHRVRVYELGEQWAASAGDRVTLGLHDFAHRLSSGDWSSVGESEIQALN